MEINKDDLENKFRLLCDNCGSDNFSIEVDQDVYGSWDMSISCKDCDNQVGV